MEYYNYYDFFVAFVVPLTTIITLNTITACAVWRPNKFGRNIKDNNRYARSISYVYNTLYMTNNELPFYCHIAERLTARVFMLKGDV